MPKDGSDVEVFDARVYTELNWTPVSARLACENSRFSWLLAARKVSSGETSDDGRTYWWRKICPESGQELWLVDIIVILFYLLFTNDRQTTKGHKGNM